MVRLFLLRHAESAPGNPDALRPLSERGIEHMHKLANTLDPALFCDVEAIWHSPYERARHTAQLASELFKINKPLTAISELVPGVDIQDLIKKLPSTLQTMLWVGHNPSLECLASYLLTKQHAMPTVRFKTASLMCLQYTPQTRQPWVIEGLFSPYWLKRT